MFSYFQKLGLTGEYFAATKLQDIGFEVIMCSQFFDDIDLVVNGVLPVEVKISLPHAHYKNHGTWATRWQFDVSRVRNPADMILIAIVQDRDGQNWPYIIPTAQLQGRLNISITSHPTKYRGQWADNLHAWQWIDYMVKKNYQQAGQLALPLLQC